MKKLTCLLVLMGTLGPAAAQEMDHEAPAAVRGWGGRPDSQATAAAYPARSAEPFRLVLPPDELPVLEGQTRAERLQVIGGRDTTGTLRFTVHPAFEVGGVAVEADSTGLVTLRADFSVADRQTPVRRVPVNVLVTNGVGERAAGVIPFVVQHVNRQPQVHELPPAYARPTEALAFDLAKWVNDEDGDPLTFSASLRSIPENATLSSAGLLSWTLSAAMFDRLPREIPFTVSDGQARSSGVLFVRRSEAGLAPRITLLGQPREIAMNEGEQVRLLLDILDPNGADDLLNVVPVTSLQVEEYQFAWPLNGDRSKAELVFNPSHDFVAGGKGTETVDVAITAVDRDRKEATPLVVRFTVNDAPDPQLLYREYRSTLEHATALLQQLTERERELDARLDRVRRGERTRRVMNAVLGMTTAAFGLFTSDQTQRIGVGVGGMLTTGLSGLEAAKVFTSPESLEKQVQDVKTELLRVRFEAEGFAREYSNPDKRATAAFNQDRRNSDRLILDARTKLKVTAPVAPVTDEEIRRFTVYFAPEQRGGGR